MYFLLRLDSYHWMTIKIIPLLTPNYVATKRYMGFTFIALNLVRVKCREKRLCLVEQYSLENPQ